MVPHELLNVKMGNQPKKQHIPFPEPINLGKIVDIRAVDYSAVDLATKVIYKQVEGER